MAINTSYHIIIKAWVILAVLVVSKYPRRSPNIFCRRTNFTLWWLPQESDYFGVHDICIWGCQLPMQTLQPDRKKYLSKSMSHIGAKHLKGKGSPVYEAPRALPIVRNHQMPGKNLLELNPPNHRSYSNTCFSSYLSLPLLLVSGMIAITSAAILAALKANIVKTKILTRNPCLPDTNKDQALARTTANLTTFFVLSMG